MSFDEVIKYLMWIIFFAIAVTGVIFLLKKVGVS